jgi:hypothetical protein
MAEKNQVPRADHHLKEKFLQPETSLDFLYSQKAIVEEIGVESAGINSSR